MTEFQQTIETLIDQFLLRLPSSIFADFPLLNVLLANPNGRYVLAGLVIVISFIGLFPLSRSRNHWTEPLLRFSPFPAASCAAWSLLASHISLGTVHSSKRANDKEPCVCAVQLWWVHMETTSTSQHQPRRETPRISNRYIECLRPG